MISQLCVTNREQRLEEALRGLSHHFTLMQLRASFYLCSGDPESFIEDILEMLDGLGQQRVQNAASKVLGEPGYLLQGQ